MPPKEWTCSQGPTQNSAQESQQNCGQPPWAALWCLFQRGALFCFACLLLALGRNRHGRMCSYVCLKKGGFEVGPRILPWFLEAAAVRTPLKQGGFLCRARRWHIHSSTCRSMLCTQFPTLSQVLCRIWTKCKCSNVSPGSSQTRNR